MKFFPLALVGTLVIACVVSQFASSHPDGLEKVAEEHGFIEKATSVWNGSPLPDYALPFETQEAISAGAAGAIGTLFTFALLFWGGKALVSKRKDASA